MFLRAPRFELATFGWEARPQPLWTKLFGTLSNGDEITLELVSTSSQISFGWGKKPNISARVGESESRGGKTRGGRDRKSHYAISYFVYNFMLRAVWQQQLQQQRRHSFIWNVFILGLRVFEWRGGRGGYSGFYSTGENKKVTFWKHRERDFSSGSDVPLSYLDCFFLLWFKQLKLL